MTLPLVIIIDHDDCSLESKELEGIAEVKAFGVHSVQELPKEVRDRVEFCIMYQISTMFAKDIDMFPKLKAITRLGAGYDSVDLNYSASKGIQVFNIPAFCVEEVADSVMAHVLCLYRKTHEMAKLVEKGVSFHEVRDIVGAMSGARRIRDSVLGIVGLGRIGLAIANRAIPFGFQIYFFDPCMSEGYEKAVGLKRCDSLKDILSISDCVVLQCPLAKNTHHLINEDTIKHVKKGAFFVNASRGGLVDDKVLAEALRTGHISAAACDVHENEPKNAKSGLFLDVPNYISTPHTAFYSDESFEELRMISADRVRCFYRDANEDIVTHSGGCHCGAVRWEVKGPKIINAIDCNCSICKKKQNRHFIVASNMFKLIKGNHTCPISPVALATRLCCQKSHKFPGSDKLTYYRCNTKVAMHPFCRVCGVQSFYVPRSNPDAYGIMPHCIGSDTVEKVILSSFDGQNWEKEMETKAPVAFADKGDANK